MNEKTVGELREEKKKELEEVIKEIKKLENEVDRKHWHKDNTNTHVGKLRELDKLYLRRRELNDFLKEINGKRLIRHNGQVMRFRNE